MLKSFSLLSLQILDDYQQSYNILGNMTYDPAEPESNRFLVDFEKFQGVLEDTDRKLASIFTQGLDECHNFEHFFKVSRFKS